MTEIDHTNPRVLRRKYWDEGMTLEEIGDAAGVTNATVLHWMDKHGIDRRTPQEAMSERRPLETRFWGRVDKGEDGECWEWTGSRTSSGYGDIWVEDATKPVTHVSLFLHTGEWPDGNALHHCDNPPCVNPTHLYVGSQAENMQDARERDRTARGERQNFSKLTEDDVREIKERDAAGETPSQIAEGFDVTPSNVRHIVAGRSWKHVEVGHGN